MKKITSTELGCLIFMLSLSNGIGTTLNILLSMAKQDSWISILIGAGIGFIPFYFIIKIIEYKPELNIFEKNEVLFGKFFGNVINIVLVILFGFMAVVALWDLNNFISSQYLHKTPSLLIGVCIILTIIYMMSKDLFVVARVAFILFIMSITLYSIGFVGLFTQLELDRLKPILNNNIIDVIKGGLLCVVYNILPIFVITVIPKDKMEIKKMTTLFKWLYFAGFIIFTVAFFIISIFGYKLASIYQYTAFHLLKNISLLGFINRIESTVSIRWIFYLIISIFMFLYFNLEYIKKVFKIKNKKIINIIIACISITILILSEKIFINNSIKEHFMLNYFPTIALIILGFIPLIIFIFTKLKKVR